MTESADPGRRVSRCQVPRLPPLRLLPRRASARCAWRALARSCWCRVRMPVPSAPSGCGRTARARTSSAAARAVASPRFTRSATNRARCGAPSTTTSTAAPAASPSCSAGCCSPGLSSTWRLTRQGSSSSTRASSGPAGSSLRIPRPCWPRPPTPIPATAGRFDPAAIIKTRPTLKSADGQAWSKRVSGNELRDALLFADPGRTAGQFVLIYDDVCTTGTQLDAVAGCLLDQGGAARVEAVVLARALWRDQSGVSADDHQLRQAETPRRIAPRGAFRG